MILQALFGLIGCSVVRDEPLIHICLTLSRIGDSPFKYLRPSAPLACKPSCKPCNSDPPHQSCLIQQDEESQQADPSQPPPSISPKRLQPCHAHSSELFPTLFAPDPYQQSAKFLYTNHLAETHRTSQSPPGPIRPSPQLAPWPK